MTRSRGWIGAASAFQDRMSFGLLLPAAVAFFFVGINGLLAFIDYHLIVLEVYLPFKIAGRFAVSPMGPFRESLIDGFHSACMLNFYYTQE